VQVHLLRAQCFAALPDTASAEEAFLKALEIDPDAKLDPSRVRPSVVTMLEQQRAQAKGELKVSADQPAEIFLDDQHVGPAPWTGQVAIGRHLLEGRMADGRMTGKTEAVVRARSTSDLALSFRGALLPPPPPLSPTEEPKRFGGLDLLADVRLAIEPAPAGSSLAMAGEIGAGVGTRNFVGSLHLGFAGQSFAMAVRGTGMLPRLVSIFGVHGSVDVPFVLLNGSLSPGLGGAVGVDAVVTRWLEPFVEVQYRHFFALPGTSTGGSYSGDSVLIGAGVRLRLP
jgi:hypothetical protein